MAPQKCERPPGNLEAAVAGILDKPEQREITAPSYARQAHLRAAPAVIAHVEHSDHAAVDILRSKDGSRLTICPMTRIGAGPWQLAGAVSSLPAVLLDATIEVLQQARDAMADGQQ